MTWLTQLSGYQWQQLEQLAAPPEPQENGKGTADGRKWLWVRANLARVTLLLPTSWDGSVFPKQQENRPSLSHHHHHSNITIVVSFPASGNGLGLSVHFSLSSSK